MWKLYVMDMHIVFALLYYVSTTGWEWILMGRADLFTELYLRNFSLLCSWGRFSKPVTNNCIPCCSVCFQSCLIGDATETIHRAINSILAFIYLSCAPYINIAIQILSFLGSFNSLHTLPYTVCKPLGSSSGRESAAKSCIPTHQGFNFCLYYCKLCIHISK